MTPAMMWASLLAALDIALFSSASAMTIDIDINAGHTGLLRREEGSPLNEGSNSSHGNNDLRGRNQKIEREAVTSTAGISPSASSSGSDQSSHKSFFRSEKPLADGAYSASPAAGEKHDDLDKQHKQKIEREAVWAERLERHEETSVHEHKRDQTQDGSDANTTKSEDSAIGKSNSSNDGTYSCTFTETRFGNQATPPDWSTPTFQGNKITINMGQGKCQTNEAERKGPLKKVQGARGGCNFHKLQANKFIRTRRVGQTTCGVSYIAGNNARDGDEILSPFFVFFSSTTPPAGWCDDSKSARIVAWSEYVAHLDRCCAGMSRRIDPTSQPAAQSERKASLGSPDTWEYTCQDNAPDTHASLLAVKDAMKLWDLATRSGKISGFVMDASNKLGVAGASIKITHGSKSKTVTTDDKGNYKANGINFGEVSIEATHSEYSAGSPKKIEMSSDVGGGDADLALSKKMPANSWVFLTEWDDASDVDTEIHHGIKKTSCPSESREFTDGSVHVKLNTDGRGRPQYGSEFNGRVEETRVTSADECQDHSACVFLFKLNLFEHASANLPATPCMVSIKVYNGEEEKAHYEVPLGPYGQGGCEEMVCYKDIAQFDGITGELTSLI